MCVIRITQKSRKIISKTNKMNYMKQNICIFLEEATNDNLITLIPKIVQTDADTVSTLFLVSTPAPHKVPALAEEEVCLSASIMWETLPPAEAAAASCEAPHRYAYVQAALGLL